MNRANTFPIAPHAPLRSPSEGLTDEWTEWSSWSLCSWDGMQVRTRTCRPGSHAPCVGRALQKRRCGPSRGY
uniref:Uncharacterized protein n=1 Tax=Steinernema glaseri TaxID=37863 RepID=A0A1I7ZGF0_9BILA